MTVSLEMLSPSHVIDSFRTVFKGREDHKRFIMISMMLVMLTHMMGEYAEFYCQFSYTKRLFGWDVSNYSYFSMVQTFTTSAGILVFSSLFHHINLNDNLIIFFSGLSGIAAQIFRTFANNDNEFFASISVELASAVFSSPIRAQITRCILPAETGKVFAMLASTESFVPILSSFIFTNVYTSTIDMDYPWQGAFYLVAAGFTLVGLIATAAVYILSKGKIISAANQTDDHHKI